MITADQLAKLFRVDRPNKHALLDRAIPKWVDTVPDWQGHLDGRVSLCITPLGLENTCYFGAIDFDAKHEDSPPIPHKLLLEMIRKHDLPMNLYRSKSGKGVHGYLFCNRPIEASAMQDTLRLYTWFFKPFLHPLHDMEIFPKQTTLEDEDGEMQNGSCIRIPYHGNQMPLFEGDPIIKDIVAVPPCLHQLPEKGDRNNFIYHMSIFLRYHGLNNVNELMYIINRSLEDNALPENELADTSESGRRHFMRKTKKGFGLGCSICPDQRKNRCKFASNMVVKELDDFMEVSILVYLSERAKIRIKIGETYEVFDRDTAYNFHKVKTAFILDHGVTGFPKIKKDEWIEILSNRLESADRLESIEPGDIGHYIIQQLQKWSEHFNTGIENLHSGKPVFINSREIMVIPQDFYQYIVQKNIVGISQEDIMNTLKKVGTVVDKVRPPAVKIPVEVLKIVGLPNVPATIVSEVEEEEIVFIPGPVVKMMNSLGIEIKPTEDCIRRNPWLQRKIIENTVTTAPKIDF